MSQHQLLLSPYTAASAGSPFRSPWSRPTSAARCRSGSRPQSASRTGRNSSSGGNVAVPMTAQAQRHAAALAHGPYAQPVIGASLPVAVSAAQANLTGRVSRPASASRQHPPPPPPSAVNAPYSAAVPARIRPASAQVRSSPPAQRSSSPPRAPPRVSSSVELLFFESPESRLHHLALQAYQAGCQRDWTALITLRLEMLAMSKLIGGAGSAGVTLARLALADAYARADLWLQASEHAKHLPEKLANMQYAQGTFDAHMLLARAYFGLSREAAAQAAAEAAANQDRPPSPTSVGERPAGRGEAARFLEKSSRQFTAALGLARAPLHEFFKNTSIRDPATQRRIATAKALEALLGLSATQAARGGGAAMHQQIETLTSAWEALDAYAQDEARRTEEEKQEKAGGTAETSAGETSGSPNSAIEQHLQALELYFDLGHAFFHSGDDANAQDNLRRALDVARAHAEKTIAAGLDEDLRPKPSAHEWVSWVRENEEETKEPSSSVSSNSRFPHPRFVHYPSLLVVVEAALLLAVSLARSDRHGEALRAFEQAKRYLLNLQEYNHALNLYYNRPERVPQPVMQTGPLPPSAPVPPAPPAPTHEPTASTEVSHAVIDVSLQALASREWGWRFNVFVCYNYEKLAAFLARGVLQTEREMALLHLALCQYEHAAVHQEAVCSLLEHDTTDGDGNTSTAEDGAGDDSTGFPSARHTKAWRLPNPPASGSPVTGLYQLEVAKGHRRLGDIYVAAGQPRTARHAYALALRILEVLYGVKKVHNVAVHHARHSAYDPSVRGARKRAASGTSPVRHTSGFGSQSVALMRAALAAQEERHPTGERHGVPAAVLKMMSSLKQALKLLKEEIRNEHNQAVAAANLAAQAQQELQQPPQLNSNSSATEQPAVEPPADSAYDGDQQVYGDRNGSSYQSGDYGSQGDGYSASSDYTALNTDAGGQWVTLATSSAAYGAGAADSSNGYYSTAAVGDAAAVPLSPTDAYAADTFDDSATASPEVASPARSRQMSRSASRAAKREQEKARAYAEANFLPPNPRVGVAPSAGPDAADLLSGQSSVLGESLELRLAKAGPDRATARQNAYDVFVAEKQRLFEERTRMAPGDDDLLSPSKSGRSTRPTSARPTSASTSRSTRPTSARPKPTESAFADFDGNIREISVSRNDGGDYEASQSNADYRDGGEEQYADEFD